MIDPETTSPSVARLTDVERTDSFWRRLAVLAGAAGVAVAICATIGILPTYRLAGGHGLWALGAAGGAVWIACAVGAVPAALLRASDPRSRLLMVQVGMALRFVLTLALAVAIALGTALPRVPLLLWVGVHYMAALAATTAIELRLSRGGRSERSA